MSACASSPAGTDWAASHAIAWSSGGSPTTRAKPAASSPPQSPASSPQISSVRSMSSVTREAEQMPAVVEELVQRVIGDGPDEVDLREQRDPEQGPREQLAQRDDGNAERGFPGGRVAVTAVSMSVS